MEPIKCYGVDNPELCSKCSVCQVACHRCDGKKCLGKQVTWEEVMKDLEEKDKHEDD